MEVYQSSLVIGIDLGDKYGHVCCLDTTTGEITEGRVTMNPKAIAKHFGKSKARLVAIEVGTHSRWVSHVLQELGLDVIVANPRRLQLITKSDSKNDRADAELLARLAAADRRLLSPVHHRSDRTQADLAILKARDSFVKSRTGMVNQVRGLTKSFGGRLKKCSPVSFPNHVRDEIPALLVPAVFPLLEAIQTQTRQIKAFDRKITKICEERYPETKSLLQIRGVGPITALAFVLVLEDPSRFKTSRAVGAYLGLRPRQNDSGMIQKQLRITKAGNPFLRRLLVQCAHYIMGPFGEDCDLRRWGRSLARRGGKNAKRRAVVAVARKLATVLHRLWITQDEYQPLRNQEQVAA
jgi:transposase